MTNSHDLASACAWLDARYPNINTRFTALLYARMGREHASDTLADRIVDTARALGWLAEPATTQGNERIREATQRLVQAFGANGPMSLEDAIERAEAFERAHRTQWCPACKMAHKPFEER